MTKEARMNKLTDYVLAIRPLGAPPGPDGIKTVDLTLGEGDDVGTRVLAGLRASGLAAADFRARVIFLAVDEPVSLVQYAALCGFAGRRIDAYADGTVLEFSRLAPDGSAFADAGRPDGFLMWAQAGGPSSGIPTVQLDPTAPGSVSP